MKKLQSFIILVALAAFILSGCEDKVYQRYKVNKPIYMSHKDLKESIHFKSSGAYDLSNPGKIYFKDNYIYINEYYKGIHVYDNSDPANPTEAGFIEIPGNLDLAIKGNILYANSAIDLVALDISNLSDIKEVTRLDSIFPYGLPEYDDQYAVQPIDTSKGIVIGWEVSEVKEEVNYTAQYPVWRNGMEDVLYADSKVGASYSGAPAISLSADNNSAGIGGSMAAFNIYGNYLYAINGEYIKIIDISDNSVPVVNNEKYIGFKIETLFISQDHLFIGSETGMYIYNLTDPTNPEQLSTFSHVQRCDPVVVEGNYAYVTLRGGSPCGGSSNELDIIDVSDLSNPNLLTTYPMEGPYGLGIDNNTLFVCDGDAGLKIYNVANPMNIEIIKQYTEINTFDVIPFNKHLIMIGNNGLYQYDYTDISDIKLLSVINIK